LQASICPKVDGASLCHIEHDKNQLTPNSIENKLLDSGQRSNFTLNTEQYDLPKGTTDWDSQLLAIINKNKID